MAPILVALLMLQAPAAEIPVGTAPVSTETAIVQREAAGVAEEIADPGPEHPAADHAAPAPGVLHLPKMTPVYISLIDPLGSKANKTGDVFAYTVARDVAIDGVVVIPAGTPGAGQVIHAKKAGGSGSSGELVLSPGELDLGGKAIRLRSLDMDAAGRDNMDIAAAVGIAAGPIGFLVRGKNFDYAAGFVGIAKTAQDLDFPAPGATGYFENTLPSTTAIEGSIQ